MEEATERPRRERHSFVRELLASCKGVEPVATAVVDPCSRDALAGPLEAAAAGLIAPILVGPADAIHRTAAAAGLDISPYRLVEAGHGAAAAQRGVALVHAGEAEAVMKGSLHSDELLHAVAQREGGLRAGRRISHVFIMDVPSYHKPLYITDAAINIAPGLEDKRDICQNAIDLAQALGVATPKVAILSAVETVTPKLPSTIDAAALCKMAERGEIVGALLDGPLAFDNAISKEAAAIKKIDSAVAGDPDILLVPNIEAGNMLAKQLAYLADADTIGIVLGARVPVILTSRADNVLARKASCAVAARLAQRRRARAAPLVEQAAG